MVEVLSVCLAAIGIVLVLGLGWRAGLVWVLGAGIPFSFEPGLSRAGSSVISAPVRPVDFSRPATAWAGLDLRNGLRVRVQHCHLFCGGQNTPPASYFDV